VFLIHHSWLKIETRQLHKTFSTSLLDTFNAIGDFGTSCTEGLHDADRRKQQRILPPRSGCLQKLGGCLPTMA